MKIICSVIGLLFNTSMMTLTQTENSVALRVRIFHKVPPFSSNKHFVDFLFIYFWRWQSSSKWGEGSLIGTLGAPHGGSPHLFVELFHKHCFCGGTVFLWSLNWYRMLRAHGSWFYTRCSFDLGEIVQRFPDVFIVPPCEIWNQTFEFVNHCTECFVQH